jgi:proteasome lid subunit RPN8/RPN11
MYRGSPPPVSVVWLGAVPFITIVAASVETYKKECCGLLLGYRSWSHWDKTRRALVEQAYQFQTSKRSRYSVTVPREDHDVKK